MRKRAWLARRLAAAAPWRGRPTDPAVAVTQRFGGGAKDPQREPTVSGVGDDVSEAFADGLQRAEVMRLREQMVEADRFIGLEPARGELIEPLLLGGIGQPQGGIHVAEGKKGAARSPAQSTQFTFVQAIARRGATALGLGIRRV